MLPWGYSTESLPISSFSTLSEQVLANQAEKSCLGAGRTAPVTPRSDYLDPISPMNTSALTENASTSLELVEPQEVETALISSAFLPDRIVASSTPDVVLLSSDNVHFYVHSSTLRAKKALQDALLVIEQRAGDPCIVDLPDHSNVVNIILHAIYDMPCSQFNHTFAEVENAVDRMPAYGLKPGEIIVRTHPLHELILSQSPLFPIQAYALAARHDMESLAVGASTYLLPILLVNIPNETAEIIGCKYLKKLFLLHYRRQQELRELLGRPFRPHPTIGGCDFSKQQDVSRAWALTSACFTLDARSDVSNQQLEIAFGSLLPLIECRNCRGAVEDKMKDVVIQWSLSKVNFPFL